MKQIILPLGHSGPPRKSPAGPKGKRGAPVRRRRRRTGRQTLNYLLLMIVAAAIVMTLSMTVFFHIEQIEVTGATKYSSQKLIDASGVKKGDNLFRVSEKAVSKKLKSQFFYIEDVRLKRAFPSKLVLEITEEQPLGACNTSSGYLIVGKTGKVLEMNAQTVPDGLMIVNGMYLSEPKLGETLGSGFSQEQKEAADLERDGFDMLMLLVSAVAETEFHDITFVDFSDRLNILIVYADRIIIELGVQQNLSFKLQFVENLIQNQLPENFEGILDASLAYSSKKVWQKPCDIEAELEKRQLTAISAVPQPDETDPTASGDESDPETPSNPNLAVKPGPAKYAPSSSSSSGGESSSGESGVEASSSGGTSSEAQSSGNGADVPSIPGGYKPSDLAVKGGPPARPTSSSESSSGIN